MGKKYSCKTKVTFGEKELEYSVTEPTSRKIIDEFKELVKQDEIIKQQGRSKMDLNFDELKKDWECDFYDSEWDCDTLTLTETEEGIMKELTAFLPRHMPCYDWNLPYADEILLIFRRHLNKKT
jgi:hypothetical protein